MSVKILIVDDEELIAEEMAEVLADEGFQCYIAHNVDQALSIVRQTPNLALILTDIKMPQNTGLDLIKTVTEEFGQKIRFIVITGGGDSKEVENLECQFLRKPLDILYLLEVVKTTLGSGLHNWTEDYGSSDTNG